MKYRYQWRSGMDCNWKWRLVILYVSYRASCELVYSCEKSTYFSISNVHNSFNWLLCDMWKLSTRITIFPCGTCASSVITKCFFRNFRLITWHKSYQDCRIEILEEWIMETLRGCLETKLQNFGLFFCHHRNYWYSQKKKNTEILNPVFNKY